MLIILASVLLISLISFVITYKNTHIEPTSCFTSKLEDKEISLSDAVKNLKLTNSVRHELIISLGLDDNEVPASNALKHLQPVNQIEPDVKAVSLRKEDYDL